MNRQDALPRDEMIEFVMSCWDDEAGEQCDRMHALLLPCDAEGRWRKALSERIQAMMRISYIH